MFTRLEFQVGELFHRKRLDEFLFNEFSAMSKAYIRRVVKEGFCEVNGYVENTGKTLKTNDFIEINVDLDQEKGMSPEEIPIEIVFEDNQIIVVNKSSGMLVHPTNYERNGTLLNALTFYVNRDRANGEKFVRPHLIHRLDRDTSGLMIIGKNARVSKLICGHFKRRLFEKRYVALVDGIVSEDSGTISAPIGRFDEERRWNVKPDGKASETRFNVLERRNDKTLLELEPVTGRTNQLRIHCAHIGHPILGDDWYGGSEFERLCLHARKIEFWHPNGNNRMSFESKLPDFAIDI
ncbi:MAG: RluA family pseudouridine synthase [Acidobacteria bacterium]|nr:RluA family pseudouridine synthase [Acidobacteriota bacterium]